VVVSDAAHALEHSLEVQLPFLQTVLAEFTLVPLAVGRASAAQVAEVLECLWGGDETLIVISSDLSHYLPYARRSRDRQQHRAAYRRPRTARSIINRPAARHRSMACCWPHVGTACEASWSICAIRATPPATARASSATAPSPSARSPNMPTEGLGSALLVTARNAIAKRFGLTGQVVEPVPELAEPGATFVTLTQGGQLRGCIGSLEAYRPLAIDVAENALAAAFRDHRFAP
jgi:hypothetical protein